MSDRFSPYVAAALQKGGWHAGRNVTIEPWIESLTTIGSFVLLPVADVVLREFGGLRMPEQGPGIECAREPFEINPLVAQGYEPEFRRAEAVVGEKLFPLGEVITGPAFLAIGESGSLYYLMETIGLIGLSFDEGLSRLVEGRPPFQTWEVDVTISNGPG